MEQSRKRKVRDLYDRIDGLNRRLSGAGKGERAKIKGQLMKLREEVARALEPEEKDGRTGVYLRSAQRGYGTGTEAQDRSLGPSAASPRIAGYRQAPEPPQEARDAHKERGGFERPTESEPGRARGHAPRPPRPERSRRRSSAGGGVSRALVRDYLYERLDELGKIILSGEGAEREEAKRERAFLEGQLEIAHGKGRGGATFDPALVAAMREGRPTRPPSGPKESPSADGKEDAPAPSGKRPPCWSRCSRMDFRQLRQFIDESLRQRFGPSSDDRPRSMEEFLTLLAMLRKKIDRWDLPPIPLAPAGPPAFPEFSPSEGLGSLLRQRGQLASELARARGNPSATKRSVKKLERKLRFLEEDIAPLNAREREEHAKRRDDHLRSYREAKEAHDSGVRRRAAEALRQRQLRPRRLEIADRVSTDIERAFGFGDVVAATDRLPWRVLPPGELSVGNVLRHYEGLQRRNPHVVYDRERIAKAFSLNPDRCYVGSDEFDGYIVFAFSRTEKVLLECPVFGNAIYVIHSDWRRLSRTTKQDLLTRRSREGRTSARDPMKLDKASGGVETPARGPEASYAASAASLLGYYTSP